MSFVKWFCKAQLYVKWNTDNEKKGRKQVYIEEQEGFKYFKHEKQKADEFNSKISNT